MEHKDIYFSIIAVNSHKPEEKNMKKKIWHFIKTDDCKLDFFSGALPSKKPEYIIDGKPFFCASWYTWISDKCFTDYSIEVRGKTSDENAADFAYIEHAGALLCAVESGDSLLAAEIFQRHKNIFLEYVELTKKILKPVAVEGLFAWIWGNFSDKQEEVLSKLMQSESVPPVKNWDVTEMFYYSAKPLLYPESSLPVTQHAVSAADAPSHASQVFSPVSETPEQMITRYFKNHRNLKLTLSLVGTCFYPWVSQNLIFFENRLKKMESKDLKSGTDFARLARQRVFSNTHCVIKAEPQNPFDKNAIGVYLDDIKAKAQGHYSFMQAGYIRSRGAAIIRNARPNILKFESQLARISNINGERNIVMELTV